MIRKSRGMLMVGLTMIGVVGIFLAPAQAATFIPSRFDDPPPDGCNPGDCSLREAVIAANGSAGRDTIQLQAGAYTLTIPEAANPESGDLDVDEGTLTIVGAASGSTIQASSINNRVIQVAGGNGLEMSRVVLTGGEWGGNGGAIATATGDSLILTDVTVTGNAAGDSGGINSSGPAKLTNVTVSGNSAIGDGGGMVVDNLSTATLNNVTVVGNAADSNLGGTGDGGGIFVTTGSTVDLSNSIVANNTDDSPTTADKAPDCSGTLTSQGFNLVRDTTNCTFTTSTGDVTGADPMVGPLSNNGGPVSSVGLLRGSPAAGAGNPAAPGALGGCAAADARGVPRVNCDMGAYELVFCQNVVVNRVGSEGNDTLKGTTAADGFLAFGGKDTVRGLRGRDGLCLGNGQDLGSGAGGKDRLLGEGGLDRLKGQGGNDRLVGGPAKDICAGGPGKQDKARRCEVTKSVP
jgi:hypothetical protein